MLAEAPTKAKYKVVRIANADDLTTRIYPSGTQDVPDLVIRPWETRPYDETFWERQPDFIRAVARKEIVTEVVDKLPDIVRPDVDDKFAMALEHNEIAFVRAVCTLPLNAQLTAAIRLADLQTETGLPRRGAERVTRDYLKLRHGIILNAALELEQRFQKRPEVLDLLRQQIKKIEEL